MVKAERPQKTAATEVDVPTGAALAASRALVGVAVRSLAVALEEMTLPQYRVLALLAEELGIHASTFSRLADRLVAGGWVRRQENPDSRREVLVDLDGPGRALVADVTARRAAEIARILARVDPSRLSTVVEGLQVFAEAAGELDPGDLSLLGVDVDPAPTS